MSNRTLITEFVVTEKCNLNCEYCYMKNNNVYMSIDRVYDFINNVHKMMDVYGCSDYHISYFGGEPLLNWEVVKMAIPLFNEDPRCSSQVIISNGLLLTDSMVDFLREYNVGFSWSFDGLWQEENRPHVTIKDTLSLYKKNKQTIQRVSRSAKVMVSPNNVVTMVDNLEFFVDEFQINNPDFSIVRDDIWTQADLELFHVCVRKLADRVIEYIRDGERVSVGFFDLALMDIYQGNKYGKRPFGCFAGCHGVGYFPDGSWYPCARFGSTREYVLMDVEGIVNEENIQTLLNPKISNPTTFDKCKKCNLYDYCTAGCTYSQLRLVDSVLVAEPLDSICQLYKMIYNNTLYINDVLKDNKLYKKYLQTLAQNIGGK